VTGNCGKPRARTSSAPLTGQPGSDIAQHLQRVGACTMNIAAGIRRNVASATDGRASRDACLRRFEGEGGAPYTCGAGFAE